VFVRSQYGPDDGRRGKMQFEGPGGVSRCSRRLFR
jgi:hypothetical protein